MADDIAQWLERIGLGQYARAFAENAIELDLLPNLTDDDLKALGVRALGHRKRLLAAIEALSADESSNRRDAIPSRQAQLESAEAERRQLTVLFCDLVGSTALSSRLDPEDMRDVLRGYQDACAGVVTRYDGFVAKFMGDGIYAYFGYPCAHEDDAERAVNAGLDIVACLSAADGPRGAGQPLQVRIGIATGMVIVGDLIGEGAAQEAAITGETPNLASRLQEIAEPNGIVIATATHALAGRMFACEGFGERALKGFASPITAWRVTGKRRVKSRFEAARGEGLTPLVGREEELDILLRCWERVKAGDGRVVLMSGEPGIGKSRLAQALDERISDDGHTRLRFQCSPFHTNSALHPVIEQIERTARFAPDDSDDAKLDKLETLLAQPGKNVPEMARLIASMLSIPTAGRYPPLNVTPQRRKELTLNALIGRLSALAERQPLLFIFEDAHWIDPTTLELMDRVVAETADARILVLVTYRPEFTAPWIDHPNVTALALGGLDTRECRTIVETVAGTRPLSTSLRDRIVAQAGGVPLFIEELTRSIIEVEGSGWNGGVQSPSAIPATIRSSLEARLDRLGTAKEVAQLGAVIGREFSHALVSAVTPLSEEELGASLEQLAETGLLFIRGSPPEAAYSFKHALVQEAAYGQLTRRRRSNLHRLVAEVLEAQYPQIVETEPETLARHFTEAGADLVEKAADYWLKAGRLSFTRSAIAESIASLRKGLETVADLPEGPARYEREIALWIALGSTLRPAVGGHHADIEQAYARAYELSRRAADTAHLFPALYGLHHVRLTRGNLEAARADAEELVRLAGEDPARKVIAHTAHSEYLVMVGRFQEAQAAALNAADAYDPAVHPVLAATYGREFGVVFRVLLAMAQLALGYPDQARATIHDMLAHGRNVRHPYAIGFSLAAATIALITMRDASAVSRCATELLPIAEEQGFPELQAIGLIGRGWSSAELGRTEGAVSDIESGLMLAHQLAPRFFLAWFHGLLAEAHLRVGRTDAAREVSAQALAEVEEVAALGGSQYFAIVLCTRAKALCASPNPDAKEAERCCRKAIDVARTQSARMWELRAASRLARLWHGQGRTTKARDLLAPVYGWFTEGFDTADLKEGKALLDELG